MSLPFFSRRLEQERRVLHFAMSGPESAGNNESNEQQNDAVPEQNEATDQEVEDINETIKDEVDNAENEIGNGKKNREAAAEDAAVALDTSADDLEEKAKNDPENADKFKVDAAKLREGAASLRGVREAAAKNGEPKEGDDVLTIDDAINSIPASSKLSVGKGPEAALGDQEEGEKGQDGEKGKEGKEGMPTLKELSDRLGDGFCKMYNIPEQHKDKVAKVLEKPEVQKLLTDLTEKYLSSDDTPSYDELEAFVMEDETQLTPTLKKVAKDLQDLVDEYGNAHEEKEGGAEGKEKPKEQTFTEAIKEFIEMFKEFMEEMGFGKEDAKKDPEKVTDASVDASTDELLDLRDNPVTKKETTKRLTNMEERNKDQLKTAKEQKDTASEKVEDLQGKRGELQNQLDAADTPEVDKADLRAQITALDGQIVTANKEVEKQKYHILRLSAHRTIIAAQKVANDKRPDDKEGSKPDPKSLKNKPGVKPKKKEAPNEGGGGEQQPDGAEGGQGDFFEEWEANDLAEKEGLKNAIIQLEDDVKDLEKRAKNPDLDQFDRNILQKQASDKHQLLGRLKEKVRINEASPKEDMRENAKRFLEGRGPLNQDTEEIVHWVMAGGDEKFPCSLSQMKKITPESAQVIADYLPYNEPLHLDGLTRIDLASAKLIAGKQLVHLSGLTSIDPQTVYLFSGKTNANQGVYLRGITTLDVHTARAIASLKCHTALDNLVVDNQDIATELSKAESIACPSLDAWNKQHA